MKRNIIIASLLVFSAALGIEACEENGCGRAMVSTYDSHEGERMKGNCMDCHSPNGGANAGCFRVGGTAFDSIPGDSAVRNAVVRLYTQPDGAGELVITLPVDKNGNFYTTAPVSFANGLYASITSKTGTRFMPTPVVNGSCNSCHGVLNANLWAD